MYFDDFHRAILEIFQNRLAILYLFSSKSQNAILRLSMRNRKANFALPMLYTHRYKMSWSRIPGFNGRFGHSENSNENDLKQMKSLVFDKTVVAREKIDCSKNKEKLWIVSPGAMKLENKKVNMLKDHSSCFLDDDEIQNMLRNLRKDFT